MENNLTFLYIFGLAIALIIVLAFCYYFTRWIFSMKRQLWNQKQQIRLLIMIAEKLGVPAQDVSVIKEKNENKSDEHL